MDHSDFVILLARQRSGTNALRSVLGTHADVFCVPEIFNDRPSPEFELAVRTNYANFLLERAGGDARSVLTLADHEDAFLDFLEYLRCFSDRRFIFIDVKYNSAHHVDKHWRFLTEEPFLFWFVREHGLRVLNVTRRNYLRYWLSEVKAHATQRWEAFDESVVGDRPWYRTTYAGRPPVADARIRLDVDETLEALELCRSESRLVADSFAGYERYLEVDYEDLFRSIGAPMSDEALDRIAAWLGVPAEFAERRPQYRKQSTLGLAETIENYDEIADALRGGPFEACLADERMYRGDPVALAT